MAVMTGGDRPKGKRARAAFTQRMARARRLCVDGTFAAGEALYRQILAKHPANLAAMRGRADALEGMGYQGRARSQRIKANERESDDICEVAGKALVDGYLTKSLRLYHKVLKLDPGFSEALWGIAESHAGQGETETAIDWYRRYLELEPDEPEAMHMLAALGASPPPSRASDDYVTAHFDRFADDFDQQLVDELNYRGPELLYEAVAPALGKAAHDLAILDLGCGTGLSARPFRKIGGRIDGVDLSGRMLSKARRRRLYDRLIEADIGAHLAKTRRRYDLVLSGDSLIYFGDLAPVFSGIRRVLKNGGLCAFSLETSGGADYRLTETGRFTHARTYIQRVAGAAGLGLISVAQRTIRTEYGESVKSDLWVFKIA